MNEREQEKAENDEAVAEYLEQGGKITVCPAGERSDPEVTANPWRRKKAGAKK